MRSLLVNLFCLLTTSLFAANDIRGFWKTINEEGKPQCVVAIYNYQGVGYGRIIGTYNDDGVMDDTIYKPIERAPGVVGEPYYCGLDFIWDLQNSGSKFKGKILDPEKGNVYKAEIWTENGDLIVRGKLFVFGRNQTWLAADEDAFPKGFKMPDPSTFVPSIPIPK